MFVSFITAAEKVNKAEFGKIPPIGLALVLLLGLVLVFLFRIMNKNLNQVSRNETTFMDENIDKTIE